jgi:hypothetical protein
MPLGTGYTVEGQVTGKEVRVDISVMSVALAEGGADQDVGGIQIDVFESYSKNAFFFTHKENRDHINSYMTPRQSGLPHGDIVNLAYTVRAPFSFCSFFCR